jgi:adenylate cyclase
MSLEVMNMGLRITNPQWRSLSGTALLLVALVFHVGLTLWSLSRRRTFKMKRWEVGQLVLGRLVPFLLIVHVMGTRVFGKVYNINGDYFTTMISLWVFKPTAAVLQGFFLAVVWAHGMMGLHMWLRPKPRYLQVRQWEWNFLSWLKSMAGLMRCCHPMAEFPPWLRLPRICNEPGNWLPLP